MIVISEAMAREPDFVRLNNAVAWVAPSFKIVVGAIVNTISASFSEANETAGLPTAHTIFSSRKSHMERYLRRKRLNIVAISLAIFVASAFMLGVVVPGKATGILFPIALTAWWAFTKYLDWTYGHES